VNSGCLGCKTFQKQTMIFVLTIQNRERQGGEEVATRTRQGPKAVGRGGQNTRTSPETRESGTENSQRNGTGDEERVKR